MTDFNNPFLTLQQKQCILSAIAQGSKTGPRLDPNVKESTITFKSHWILDMSDLLYLNTMCNKKLKTTFALNQDLIQEYYPDFSVVLFEADRVEKGEWDNFERKWVSVGYQHTFVIGCNGLVASVDDQGFHIMECELDPNHKSNCKYRATLETASSRQGIFSIGLLDVPLEDLAEYEDRRHHKEVSALSNAYKETFASALTMIRSANGIESTSVSKSIKRGFAS